MTFEELIPKKSYFRIYKSEKYDNSQIRGND